MSSTLNLPTHLRRLISGSNRNGNLFHLRRYGLSNYVVNVRARQIAMACSLWPDSCIEPLEMSLPDRISRIVIRETGTDPAIGGRSRAAVSARLLYFAVEGAAGSRRAVSNYWLSCMLHISESSVSTTRTRAKKERQTNPEFNRLAKRLAQELRTSKLTEKITP